MKLFTESKTRYSTFSDQLEKAKESASSISKSTTILKNTFIKRSKLRRKSYLDQQKREKIKKEKTQRSVKERQLEKPSVGFKNFLGSAGSKIKKASGNVFEAIMYLLIGWLVNKLPEIIDGVKKIYGRIKKIVNVLKSFIGNLTNWFAGIGDVVNQATENLKNYDFFDSKGKLKEKMDELENSWKAIETDIKEGKKLLTTPLSDEDLDDESASGEKIDMNLSQQEAYNKIYNIAKEQGGAKYPELVAAIAMVETGYLTKVSGNNPFNQRGVDGNFKKYDSIEDSVREHISFWHKSERNPGNANAFDDPNKAWASMVDSYAPSSDGNNPSAYKKSVANIIKTMTPKNDGKGGGNGNRKMNGDRFFGIDSKGKVVGRIGRTGRSSGPHLHIETGNGYGGAGGYIPQNVLNNIIIDGKPLSSYNMGDGLGAGRNHRGFDYPIRSGAPITLKGNLKLSEYDSGYNAGYGNSIIITDGNGRQYLLGHLSSGPEGIKAPRSGTDSLSTQPFNRQTVNQTPRKSRRKVIVMVEENDMTPQIIQGSGGSSQIVVINPLNSFIKNQLLLDLAYT